jgi:ribonuclease-3 family protein
MEKSLKDLLKSLKNINSEDKLDNPQNEQVLKLAFVGDTIFDLFTRDLLNRKYADKIKINELHKKNSELVCAKSQSKISDYLVNDVLNDEEINFFKHARNAHSHSKSKNSSIVDYRKATGLEALLGLLFYKDEKRLIEVLDKIAEQVSD